MASRDEIQRLKDMLCLDGLPPFIAPLINDLAGMIDANFDALVDNHAPSPEFDPLDGGGPLGHGDFPDGPAGGDLLPSITSVPRR